MASEGNTKVAVFDGRKAEKLGTAVGQMLLHMLLVYVRYWRAPG